MGNSEGWDYNPDLAKGKVTEDDVDAVVERDDEEPDFGFEMDEADDEDADGATSEDGEVDGEDKPVTKEPADKANADATDKIAEAVLKHVGGKTLVRIKGVEKPLESFSKQEIVNWIQKSARADQVFQESAASRRQVEEERQRLERERESIRRDAELAHGRGGTGDAGKTTDGNIPDFLKPGAYDTEESIKLKQYTASLQERLDRLEGNVTQNQQREKLNGIQREVDELGKEYPMASRDEVLAVKLAHPDVSTEELMRMAHQYYSSKDHISAAFKANPEYQREYNQSVIQDYIKRKQTAKKIAGQPVAAKSSSSKVGEKARIPIRNFDDALKASKAYLRESRRVADED